jgi:hypothetical protein
MMTRVGIFTGDNRDARRWLVMLRMAGMAEGNRNYRGGDEKHRQADGCAQSDPHFPGCSAWRFLLATKCHSLFPFKRQVLVQNKRIHYVTRAHQDVLAPVEHVGFCCAGGMDFCVPQRFAVQRITRDQVPVRISGEEQLARGRQ